MSGAGAAMVRWISMRSLIGPRRRHRLDRDSTLTGREFDDAVVVAVGHVNVAGAVDGGRRGVTEAGERQFGLAVRSGRQLKHAIVVVVGDVDVAGLVDGDVGGIAQPDEG